MLIACTAVLAISAAAQPGSQPDPTSQDPIGPPVPDATQDPQDAPIVREILVEPAGSEDTIRRILKTQTKQPLRPSDVADDIRNLMSQLRILAEAYREDLPGGGVRVIFSVTEWPTFERFSFKGLASMSEREVRTLLNLGPRQRMNELAAAQYAATLRDRYRRLGFTFVQVRIEKDLDQSELIFWVDEGPKVTVDQVHVIGNPAFPFWAPLDFYDNLEDSAELESAPAGALLGGDPYSAEVVDEDLDRLRLFYRKRGFRDARVELAGAVFSEDRSKVDLTFLVDEGPRYRIASIDLEQLPPPGQANPTYSKERVLEEIELQPGEYYDFREVELDKRRITSFYGRRGHPEFGRYGRGIENAFQVLDTVETFDVENSEIHLKFVVDEGSPKTLRSVRISGNSDTEDRVIRRKVRILPGEILDMKKVDRSLSTLDALRYFQDPQNFGGVRFELEPVREAPDLVDLDISVTEGDTGSFLWGAGVSSANGVQARFVLSKRNFDYRRLPSTWNPISWFSEIANNEAFHGSGQELELVLAPGTQISMFQLSFYEPDIFNQHFDTYGLRLQGYRRLQFYDSFLMDALGANVGLERNLSDEMSVGLTLRQETLDIRNPDPNAPTIVWDSEGQTELRGVRLQIAHSNQDSLFVPTSGSNTRAYTEVLGGVFGADEDIFKVGGSYTQYFPLYRDERDRAHTLRWRSSVDYGVGFGRSDDLYLTERFYMGGSNLRGFAQRRAGPSQFGQPVGGEIRILSSLEYGFPIFSTQKAGQIRQTEVLRGVTFLDYGHLGLSIDEIGPPRLSAGVGLRVIVPVLEVPIRLDVGWPILDETTDVQRQFFFSLSRF